MDSSRRPRARAAAACRLSMALAATLLLVRPAAGQVGAAGGRAAGDVRDVTGAPLPGCQAELRHTDTNLQWTAQADGQGHFEFLALPVGPYELTVHCGEAFRKATSGFVLAVGQIVHIPVVLEMAGVTEHVTVATATTLEPTRTSTATVIRPAEIDSLAVNGRNYLDLALLAPGVSRTNTGSNQRFAETSAVPGTGISVSSQRNLNNTFLVDGLSANDDAAGLSGAFYSQEVVREFQVITSGAPTELGRASAGAIAVVTKSGTNDPRARAYGFFRDDALDARNPLARREDPLEQAQYGLSAGGPIVRDRAFIFGNVEGYDEERTGFVTIDPAAAQTINAVLDRTRTPGARVGTGDFPSTTQYLAAFVRADARVGEAAHTAVRYSLYDIASTNARTAGGLNDVSRSTSLDNRDHTIAWTLSAPVGRQALADVRAQYVRSALAAPPTATTGPAINISGVASFGPATSSPTGRVNDLVEMAASLAAPRGRHLLKGGVDLLYNRVTIDFPGALGGVYTFGSLAAFEQGRYITFQQAFGEPSQTQHNPNAGFYVQDEWRVREDLTLTAGLRYELQFLASPIRTDTDNLAPRLGIVWAPGDRRTVWRASVGRHIDRIPLRAVSNALQRDGSKYRVAVLSYGQQGAPMFPYVLPEYPEGVLPSITTIDPDIELATSLQAALQVEREIGPAVVSLGYEHLRARGLIMSRNVNVPTLTAEEAARLGIPNLGRPDPTVANNSRYGSLGDSWYDGLTVSLVQRSVRPWNLRLSYTWSKALDTAGNFFFSTPQNSFDIADEKGPSNNDQRHRLVASGTLLVPDANAGAPWWRRAVAGVQLGVIASYGSALPFNVQTGTDRNADTNVNDRPEGVGRNTGRGFDQASVDVRLSRRFRAGRVTVEGLIEAFNVFNRTNLQLPNNIFGTGVAPLPTFGQATAAGDPRQVQLGVRIGF